MLYIDTSYIYKTVFETMRVSRIDEFHDEAYLFGSTGTLMDEDKDLPQEKEFPQSGFSALNAKDNSDATSSTEIVGMKPIVSMVERKKRRTNLLQSLLDRTRSRTRLQSTITRMASRIQDQVLSVPSNSLTFSEICNMIRSSSGT